LTLLPGLRALAALILLLILILLLLLLLLAFGLFDQGVQVLDNVALKLLGTVARVFLSQTVFRGIDVFGNAADDFFGILLRLNGRLVTFLFFFAGFFLRRLKFLVIVFFQILVRFAFFLKADRRLRSTGLWIIIRPHEPSQENQKNRHYCDS